MATNPPPAPPELTPEQMVGFDTARLWATGAQVFANPDFTLVVIREQINVADESGASLKVVYKNLTSFVMPTQAAREFSTVLANQLAQIDAPAAE